MKLVLSIFVLFCFITNMFGTWVMFGIYQLEVRKEMKNFILSNKEKFTTVEFKITDKNANSFNRNYVEDELTYKNVKYDIVAQKVADKQLVLICIEDKNETNVINKYNSLVEKEKDHPQFPKSKTQNHVSMSAYDDMRYFIGLDKVSCFILNTYLLSPEHNLNKVLIEIITPPPQNNYC